MYSCESWTVKKAEMSKNYCLRTVVLGKTPGRTLDSNEIKPVNLKGNQPWILIRRTDDEAGALVFWSEDENSRLIGKVSDTGKDWGQKEKRAWEDEMAGWHHQCNGHELRQTSHDGEGQEGLACCSPWGCKEYDTTGQPNHNGKEWKLSKCHAQGPSWDFTSPGKPPMLCSWGPSPIRQPHTLLPVVGQDSTLARPVSANKKTRKWWGKHFKIPRETGSNLDF